MNEKLRILMQRENLTASRLAEILEIQPAAVSHILKGRNKPSFELVCKIVNRFPQINPYWLLGEAEEIYNNTTTSVAPSSRNLFDVKNENISSGDKSNISNIPIPTLSRSDIEKIIIVYHDQTFEELKPKKI